jgi:uncharacterized membrane protein YagU involved in acid resistance
MNHQGENMTISTNRAANTSKNRIFLIAFARKVLWSGSLAALAMIPFGIAFTLLGLDVNEYGKAIIQTFFGQLPLPARFGLFVVEHFIISWIAAIPLLAWLSVNRSLPPWLVGAIYGAGFWVVFNSLLLPFLFGRPTPWQLGIQDILPSLTVHLVYGLTIAWTSRS